jgi:hypothetical protein
MWTGGAGISSSAVRGAAMTGCRSSRTWVRLWRPTCRAAAAPREPTICSLPAEPLAGRSGPDLVGDVVERACARAGLPRVGPHRRRHALAGELLRRGAEWPRSARSFAIRTWPPPPSTPRLTSTRCAKSASPGRERPGERAGAGPGRLPAYHAGEDMQAKDPVVVDLPRTPRAKLHLLVRLGRSRAARAGRRPPGCRVVGGPITTLIAPTPQAFFTDRLTTQRQGSPAPSRPTAMPCGYCSGFVHRQSGMTPAQLDWDDLDATMTSSFLDNMESERGNSIRTQHSADRDPLVVLLRRPAPSRARTGHPARPGHPPEAVRQAGRDVPDRTRGRRPTRRPGPVPLGRPTRPHPHVAGHPDPPAGLRAHRPELR